MAYINRNQKERVVTLPGLLLLELKGFLHMLEDIIMTDEKLKVRVYKDYYLCSSMFEKTRFHSIQQLENGYKNVKENSIFLPLATWDLFVLKFEHICHVLGVDERRGDKTKKRLTYLQEGVQMTEGYLYTAMVVNNGSVKFKYGDKFYTEDSARNCAKKALYHADKDAWGSDCEILIRKETARFPPGHEIMKLIFYSTVAERVLEKAKEFCNGCFVKSPSQKDHLGDGGCMDPIDAKLKHHFSHILCEIKPHTLNQQFDRLRAAMGLKPMLGLQLAIAAKAYIDRDHLLGLHKEKYFEQPKIKALIKMHEELEMFK